MAALNVRGVHKQFGPVEVLKGIDLTVENGEFAVLLGPSGCGKSTLLNVIAGLERPDGGTVEIGERVVNAIPPKDRDIAMVFQSYALYPAMTVRRNITFGMECRGVPKLQQDEAVKRVAALLQIERLLERKPAQLSGGQRQRVAMGRALVRDPLLFLFDEPLSNLDAQLRLDMRTEIKELHQRLKTTSIYVTHDQIEAMTMADKIVVMRDGIVEQTGGPLDLYDRPVNTFVAGFIGSPAMNMIPGTARHTGGGAQNVDFGDGVLLPVPSGARVQDGQAVLFGLRPEHCALGDNGLPVQVVVVEPTGADTQLYCRFNGQEVTATIGDRADCRPGDRINLAPDLRRAHLFDAATGSRLVA